MSGRRLAKRQQINEVGTSQGFDQRRFISQKAESYHNERLLSRAMVREKDIQGVDDIAQRRHWENFLNDPGVANKTLVREFYVNLRFTDQQRHTVMVKGKNIKFSARTINSLFGTPSIDTPGEWTLSRLNEPIHFSHTKLTFAMDNWLRFVSTRLLPSSHTFEVTRERAVMIYTILTDVHFDIGRFLHRSILKSGMGGLTVGLYHPSLITELCARAAPGLEARVDRLADEVHQLQLQQEQQFSYQQQWWALWADQMNIPMSSRPHYPPEEPAKPPPNMGDE
ncbi:hypothetical protein CDL12_01654 [Handroanthus impetiginosus]|uniref:Putative plant transposon protein domain-containing protein n=1 Tax=Handroanthus impetiginosus TaxID=429701 RepID=A0A2G9I778_9LAMI|nr:hypothetical protein CDL12_01654 [Handroanthus impetiginosus]